MKWSVLLMFFSFGVIACSEKKSTTSQAPVQAQRLVDSSHFSKREKSNEYGSFTLYSINSDYFKLQEQESKELSLDNLHTDIFGFQTYTIKNHPVTGTVLTISKILIKNKFADEKPSIQRLPDGNVKMFLEVAFINGLGSSADFGLNHYPLSADYQISNKSDYFKFISSKTGVAPKFASLANCPGKFTISGSNQESIILNASSAARACEFNTFISYEVILTDSEYFKFLEDISLGNKAQVSAVFNFDSGVITASHDYKLHLGPIKNSLLKDLSSNAGFLDEVVVDQTIVRTINALDVGFPDSSFSIQTIVTAIKDSLFDRFYASECQLGAECLRLKSKVFDGVVLPVLKNETTLASKALSVSSSATLAEVISETSPVIIESQGKDLFNPPAEYLINNSMRSVREGDVIELKVNRFLTQGFSFNDPKVTVVSNPVCLKPYSSCLAGSWTCTNTSNYLFNTRPVCSGGVYQRCDQTKHVCTSWSPGMSDHAGMRCDGYADQCIHSVPDCHGWTQISDQKPMCEMLTAPAAVPVPFRMSSYPQSSDFRFDCNQKTDSSCDPSDIQDQWARTSQYSLPVSLGQWVETDLSTLDVSKFIDSIQFQFSNGVNCNLRDLSPVMTTQGTILIHVLNNDACSIYDSKSRDPLNYPSLSILSRFSQKTDYQCGQRSESFNGAVRYTCIDQAGEVTTLDSTVSEETLSLSHNNRVGIWKSYYPPVRLEAEMRFVGNDIESNSKAGEVK